MEVRKNERKPLREIMIKIGLERLDTQEGITVEALLDSGATGLVMSSEFARKKGFKLKKLERPMQVRNVDGSFNREGPIENTVEVNVYYKGHVERTEIDVIEGQKWGVILGMHWPPLPSTFLRTPRHLNLPCLPVYFWIMVGIRCLKVHLPLLYN